MPPIGLVTFQLKSDGTSRRACRMLCTQTAARRRKSEGAIDQRCWPSNGCTGNPRNRLGRRAALARISPKVIFVCRVRAGMPHDCADRASSKAATAWAGSAWTHKARRGHGCVFTRAATRGTPIRNNVPEALPHHWEPNELKATPDQEVDFAIRKSLIARPAARSSFTQRGCLPRPDQVIEGSSGFRNLGCTFG